MIVLFFATTCMCLALILISILFTNGTSKRPEFAKKCIIVCSIIGGLSLLIGLSFTFLAEKNVTEHTYDLIQYDHTYLHEGPVKSMVTVAVDTNEKDAKMISLEKQYIIVTDTIKPLLHEKQTDRTLLGVTIKGVPEHWILMPKEER